MDRLLGVVGTALGAFVGTNIDDFVALTLLVLGLPLSQLKRWQVFAGQYLGFAVLLAVSLAGAFGLAHVPGQWAGLLGLVPLGLGVTGLIRVARHRQRADFRPIVVSGVIPVAVITVANGGDNIAVYAVLFRSMRAADLAVTTAVFFVLLTVWCATALAVRSSKHLVPGFLLTSRWTTPAVFAVVGIVILIRTGVFADLL